MVFERLVEEEIKKAIGEGKFSGLKGEGKPVNLDEYFAAPEDLRVGYALLKNHKLVPLEIELMIEIGELKEKLRLCKDEKESKILNKLLNEKSITLSLIIERNRLRKRRF